MSSGFNGPALGAIAVGGILVWSGIKGASITGSLRQLITGTAPTGTNVNPITSTVTTAPVTGVIGAQSSALPSSGTYNTAQLQALWLQAGGSAATKVNAACHAMQESSGNPQATSANPDGGTNVGLWQLDTKGVGAGYSVQALQNALNNARITVMATANGTNWSQWSTPGCS
jgi:hypothetical protein